MNLVTSLESYQDENGRLALESGREMVLEFKQTDSTKGKFDGQVLGPSGRLTVTVIKKMGSKFRLSFVPLDEGDHYIHMYWNNSPLKMSPLLGYCPGKVPPLDASKVQVCGNGSVQARATIRAEFIIDGQKAGNGTPTVTMRGIHEAIPVEMKVMKYNRYKCTYNAPSPGGYLLYVKWSGKEVPGCPWKISVVNKANINSIKFNSNQLVGCIAGKDVVLHVDTTAAGQGDLTAICRSIEGPIQCDVFNTSKGIYKIQSSPDIPGCYILEIRFDHEHIPGSPFNMLVGEPPDAKEVHVYGPGIEDGVLYSYQSNFIVETAGAGNGKLAVKIKGPKGAFNVNMKKSPSCNRTVICNYKPLETGEYVIQVTWSDENVTGSPFVVRIYDSPYEQNMNKPKDKDESRPRAVKNNSDTQWSELI
ncbi:filamin-A-like [Argonauta hians]